MSESLPYFRTEARRAALVAACRARAGTPFREGMEAIGKGYDCAPFVRDCFRAAGVETGAFDDCPRMSLQWGRHHDKSVLTAWLLEIGSRGEKLRLKLYDEDDELMCGDILVIRDLKCLAEHHMALAVDANWAWHVPFGGEVSCVPMSLFRNPRRNQIKAVFRLVEVADV